MYSSEKSLTKIEEPKMRLPEIIMVTLVVAVLLLTLSYRYTQAQEDYSACSPSALTFVVEQDCLDSSDKEPNQD